MKRIIAIVMVLVLAVSVCACGAKGTGTGTQPSEKNGTDTTAFSAGTEQDAGLQEETDQTTDPENSKSGDQPEQGTSSAEGNTEQENASEDEDAAALAALGDVETENGILTVSLTVPADLAGEITQEELDKSKGELYQSAVRNDDGSVTYKMTKKQHRAMLKSLAEGVDESAQEMIDDNENYSIAAITHNDDCTEFNVTLDGTEIGFGDYFVSYSFFMYGLLYGKFSGHTPEHMIVNYYDPDGNLIDAVDSADLEDSEGSEEAEDYINTGENTY